jgi:alanine racemase
MLIAGRRRPILGTICMDWVFLDVTDPPGVGPGEEVVVMGGAEDGNITADEIAEQTGTIPYEVLCNVSKRVPRRYVP